jgi:hypothetical protein
MQKWAFWVVSLGILLMDEFLRKNKGTTFQEFFPPKVSTIRHFPSQLKKWVHIIGIFSSFINVIEKRHFVNLGFSTM